MAVAGGAQGMVKESSTGEWGKQEQQKMNGEGVRNRGNNERGRTGQEEKSDRRGGKDGDREEAGQGMTRGEKSGGGRRQEGDSHPRWRAKR